MAAVASASVELTPLSLRTQPDKAVLKIVRRKLVLDAVQEAELYIGEPVMHLQNDLYMVFDDPDYFG